MESFSSRVKQELSEINIWKNSNEIIAELYGYLLTFSNNKIVTENDYNINRFAKILKNLDYNNFSIQISGKNYIIEIIDKGQNPYQKVPDKYQVSRQTLSKYIKEFLEVDIIEKKSKNIFELKNYVMFSELLENNKLEEDVTPVGEKSIFQAIVYISISMGIGAFINPYLKEWGITLPAYIACMFVAAIFRNITDLMKKPLPFKEIEIVGNISLALFLSMALMSLKLWELADLAGPLVIILLIQTVIMAAYAYFVTFNVMGRDYDAAVIACGHCGFGLGASPNAIANMETFTTANGPSPKAFFVLPIVAALFIDFTNAAIITTFAGFLTK